MSGRVSYQKTVWVNDADPPISAENLNKMEDGIAQAHDIAIELEDKVDDFLEEVGDIVGQIEEAKSHDNSWHKEEYLTSDTLPIASTTTLGIVKIGDNINIDEHGEISVEKYTHPSTHPASMIVESSDRRFVSDAEKSNWNAKESAANKGQPNGYASLDSDGKIPLSQIPDMALQQPFIVADQAERLAIDTSTLRQGDKCIEIATGSSYVWDGSAWVLLARTDWDNVQIKWSNITGKPQSSSENIDDAVAKRHEHTNMSLLEAITSLGSGKIITDAERAKLSGIEEGANKYIHPATHPITMIEPSENLVIMTMDERLKLDAIEEGANYFELKPAEQYNPTDPNQELGGIFVGDGLTVNGAGVVSLNFASGSQLGGIKVGTGLVMDGNNRLNLKSATPSSLGGIVVGTGLSIDGESKLNLNVASPAQLGGVMVGGGLSVDANSKLNLKAATANDLGGVRIGERLTITPSGILSADVQTEENFTTEYKNKLIGIEEGANKYIHPDTHPASMIVESSNRRFVSDAEKINWNAKWTFNESDIKAVVSGMEIDAATVNGYTVMKSVPADAKFTDTVYTHPATHPITMIQEVAGANVVVMTKAERDKLASIEAGAQVNTVTSVAGRTGAVTLTKSDVGLSNVENYGVATRAQAEAGTANNVYMTPLRVKEAILALTPPATYS